MNDVTDKTVEHSFLLQINYKSGNSIKAWFDKFDIKKTGGDITSMEWVETKGQGVRVIFIGIDDIESIFQLEHKERVQVAVDK